MTFLIFWIVGIILILISMGYAEEEVKDLDTLLMIIIWPVILMLILAGGISVLIFNFIEKGLFLLVSLPMKLGGFIKNKMKGN